MPLSPKATVKPSKTGKANIVTDVLIRIHNRVFEVPGSTRWHFDNPSDSAQTVNFSCDFLESDHPAFQFFYKLKGACPNKVTIIANEKVYDCWRYHPSVLVGAPWIEFNMCSKRKDKDSWFKEQVAIAAGIENGGIIP